MLTLINRPAIFIAMTTKTSHAAMTNDDRMQIFDEFLANPETRQRLCDALRLEDAGELHNLRNMLDDRLYAAHAHWQRHAAMGDHQ